MTNKLGAIAEQLAEKWLVKNKFKIVAKNVWLLRFGEIDIIAKKKRVFHFIEVKALSTPPNDIDAFSPEIHFTKHKKEKLEKLAQYFANKNNINNFQIDLIAIQIFDNSTKIKYYPNP